MEDAALPIAWREWHEQMQLQPAQPSRRNLCVISGYGFWSTSGLILLKLKMGAFSSHSTLVWSWCVLQPGTRWLELWDQDSTTGKNGSEVRLIITGIVMKNESSIPWHFFLFNFWYLIPGTYFDLQFSIIYNVILWSHKTRCCGNLWFLKYLYYYLSFLHTNLKSFFGPHIILLPYKWSCTNCRLISVPSLVLDQCFLRTLEANLAFVPMHVKPIYVKKLQ